MTGTEHMTKKKTSAGSGLCVGVVGVPGAWSSERLADAIEAKTGFRLLIDLAQVRFDSVRDTVMYRNRDLGKLDGLIIKKISSQYSPDRLDRLELLDFLYRGGQRIFSSPSAIMSSYSRVSCTLRLLSGGIPMPPTVLTEDVQQAIKAIQEYKSAVLKPLYTSKARGMVVMRGDDPDLAEKVQDYLEAGNKIIYIQKMIDIPGRDLGVVFLGGAYVATYARVSSGSSWNTTTVNGGRYQSYRPSDEIIELARKAQALFGLDFTSVDVVETQDGPRVFEVSAFGGFRGLVEGNGIDAADLYADYVLKRIGS